MPKFSLEQFRESENIHIPNIHTTYNCTAYAKLHCNQFPNTLKTCSFPIPLSLFIRWFQKKTPERIPIF